MDEIKTELKEQEKTVTYERFDIKQETKLLSVLKKLFNEQTELLSEDDIAIKEDVAIVDSAHVCLVSAKTQRAKLLLRRFYDITASHKIPSDLAMGLDKEVRANSAYSIDYFDTIMKVIKIVDDHFHIRFGVDSPCVIETEDFKILLAPRIESE